MITTDLSDRGFPWRSCRIGSTEIFISSPVSDSLICKLLAFDRISMSDIEDVVIRENTFFSLIAHTADEVLLACDRIRSSPLFYELEDGGVRISNHLHGADCDGDVDADAILEFESAGFVSGEKTICGRIRQVQAGEIVRIYKSKKVESKFYYSLSYCFTTEKSYDDLSAVVGNVCKSLLSYAGNRQLVVPLSGGCDSRLLLMALVECGHENIISFTYGLGGDAESFISKNVADKLGVRWVMYPHEPGNIKSMWNSERRVLYEDFAFNGVSLPHYQDFFAVWGLKDAGVIEPDAIFVPGHSADFNAGSHLPSFLFESSVVKKSKLVRHLADKHYRLAGRPPTHVVPMIQDRVGQAESLDSVAAAGILDTFNMRERQAKFIVNSCRIYEFFGHEWWLPFWDERFVEFWRTLPFWRRNQRAWYVDYVRKRSEAAGLGPLYGDQVTPGLLTAVMASAKRVVPSSYRRKIRMNASVKNHMLNPYVVFDKHFVQGCIASGCELNGIFAKDVTKNLPSPRR